MVPTPRSGQLEAAFPLKPAAGPPLSVVKTIIEFWSMSFSDNALTTFPTDSSSLETIAAPNQLMVSSTATGNAMHLFTEQFDGTYQRKFFVPCP